MSAVRRKPRAHHPDRVRDALLAQVEIVRLAAPGLTAEQRAAPSGLPGWDVRTLLAHIAGQIDALPRLLAEPPPAATRPAADLNTWAVSTAGIAADLDKKTRRDAEAAGDQVAALDAAAEEVEAVLETGVREDVLLPHRLGAMRALDFTVTRVVELVVHSDDLTRATGHPVRLDRGALAITVRVLADALAARAPGASTELRVPPFAAVQCLPGPRHTRGTPPNVVETDPLTWLRLATGRTTWEAATASGRLRAGGERASALASELPVLG
ncbi:sterol carrier family protein [Streptomyces sp. SBT349]|uniref:sterol carrier family protein n=1 Tax=Streptomyces sp. SBT349 TaxID=1580539 RepID=UPI00066E07EB|nr:sterol carrier family protein [Streptomyces sp. SBT349]